MNQGQPPICAFVDNLRMTAELAPGSGWARMLFKPTKARSFQGNVVDLFWFCISEAVRYRGKTDLDSRLRDTLVKLEDWLKEVRNKISLPGKFQMQIYHCGILPRILTWSRMVQRLYRTVSLLTHHLQSQAREGGPFITSQRQQWNPLGGSGLREQIFETAARVKVRLYHPQSLLFLFVVVS